MPFLDGLHLTAARAYITAAWVDHLAAAGIDHLKAAAAIGNGTIVVRLLIRALPFAGIGFLVGHGATS